MCGRRGGVFAAVAAAASRRPHTLQLGLADEPDNAAALRHTAPFGFHYHHLGGGLNMGQG